MRPLRLGEEKRQKIDRRKKPHDENITVALWNRADHNYWCNLCGHYSVLKVIVIVPCWLYWVVGWVGHGSNFSFVMGWAGLGWVGSARN